MQAALEQLRRRVSYAWREASIMTGKLDDERTRDATREAADQRSEPAPVLRNLIDVSDVDRDEWNDKETVIEPPEIDRQPPTVLSFLLFIAVLCLGIVLGYLIATGLS